MFIVLVSLLCKILNACQNYIHGIVAYTFINICEKNHQFLSSIKKDVHKRKVVSFFLPHGVEIKATGTLFTRWVHVVSVLATVNEYQT